VNLLYSNHYKPSNALAPLIPA